MKQEVGTWAVEEVRGLAMSLYAWTYNIFNFGGLWVDHKSEIMKDVEGPNHKVIFKNSISYKPVHTLGK